MENVMIVDNFLGKLDKVRKTGRDSWRACCPGHNGSNPTALTIREVDDGRVLIKCFHGCSVEQIVSSVGMQVSDLFPQNPISPHKKPERLPFNPRDVLAAMGSESMIVAMCGSDISKGKALSDAEMKRLLLAVSRIKSAVEMCHAV
jgi:hypothetical protein